MPIVETYVASCAGGFVAYGYLLKASPEHEDALEEIQLGKCHADAQASIPAALETHRWAAEAFAGVQIPGKAIVGYQVATETGEHWADRMSFEVLDADMAMQDFIAARAASADWRLVPISEGDVEQPSYLSAGE